MSGSLGYATFDLVPSLRGLQSTLRTQLAPVLESEALRAGASAGGNIEREIGSHGGTSALSFFGGWQGIALGAGLAAASTVGALMGQALAVGIGSAANIQSAQISFESLLGKAQGDKFAAQLQKFADLSPAFRAEDATQAAKALIGAGVSASDTLKDLSALGDAFGTFGASTQDSSTALLGFSQIAARGTVDLQDLRQIQMAIPSVNNEMAKALGVSTASLGDLISSGKIAASDALPKLVAQLQADYGGNAARQLGTLNGAASAFSDTIKTDLGNALLTVSPDIVALINSLAPAVSGMISGFGTALGNLHAFIQQHKPEITTALHDIKNAWDATTGAFAAWAKGPDAQADLRALAGLAHALEDVLNWVGKHPAAVRDFVNAYLKVQSIASQILNPIYNVAHAFGNAYEAVRNFGSGSLWQNLVGAVGRAAREIANAAETVLGSGWTHLARDIARGFLGDWTSFASDITAAIEHPFTQGIADVKALLGINSPSRVMAEIAGYTAQGFLNGMAAHASDVTAAYGIFAAPGDLGAVSAAAIGYSARSSSAPVGPIYVQNPFTGEYMLAKMADTADRVTQAAFAEQERYYKAGTIL